MAEREEKHPFEQDAEESEDDSFIDDADVDESDSDAADMVRSEMGQMRNRRTWIEWTGTCPMCRCDVVTDVEYRVELQGRGLPHNHSLSDFMGLMMAQY